MMVLHWQTPLAFGSAANTHCHGYATENTEPLELDVELDDELLLLEDDPLDDEDELEELDDELLLDELDDAPAPLDELDDDELDELVDVTRRSHVFTLHQSSMSHGQSLRQEQPSVPGMQVAVVVPLVDVGMALVVAEPPPLPAAPTSLTIDEAPLVLVAALEDEEDE